MFKTLIKLSLAVFLATSSIASFATAIHGAILFSSFDWDKDGTTLTVIGPSIVASTDDLMGQTGVVINDLDYSPFSALDPWWETDDYLFAVSTLTIISETATGLELEGVGIISDKNAILDDTVADWTFSGGVINWSSATISECGGDPHDPGSEPASCHAVPAPTTLAIFGLGLAGLGWSRRRNQHS